MAVSMTGNAVARVRKQLADRGRGVGLRVGVKKTGCSGWAYTIDFADEIGPNDAVFEDGGVQVVVDRGHLELMDGTEIDYKREGLNEAFRFNNPRVAGTCGCGESFTIA
ncbi:MAG: iron-sulfur cluster assembly accessory protein [Xanthomonadaceae bacterium]|nr:iron-sulfur cluster assembly accessory protein [Xanthomonadaceae bacterium]